MRYLSGHKAHLSGLAGSPDGSLFASGDTKGTLRLWDWTTFEDVAVFDEFPDGLEHLEFSPCGRWLAAISSSSQVVCLEVATGEIVVEEQCFLHIPMYKDRRRSLGNPLGRVRLAFLEDPSRLVYLYQWEHIGHSQCLSWALRPGAESEMTSISSGADLFSKIQDRREFPVQLCRYPSNQLLCHLTPSQRFMHFDLDLQGFQPQDSKTIRDENGDIFFVDTRKLTCSPKISMVAISTRRTYQVILCQILTSSVWQPTSPFPPNGSAIPDLTFSVDGRYLAWIDFRGFAQVAEVTTASIRTGFDWGQGKAKGRAVILAPDLSTLLVAGDRNRITIYDLDIA